MDSTSGEGSGTPPTWPFGSPSYVDPRQVESHIAPQRPQTADPNMENGRFDGSGSFELGSDGDVTGTSIDFTFGNGMFHNNDFQFGDPQISFPSLSRENNLFDSQYVSIPTKSLDILNVII
jgi:hypothetical protein